MSRGVAIGGLAAAMLAASLALPTVAAAQSPAGPFAELFGRTPPRVGMELTRVDVRGSLGGQYDGALARGGAPVDPTAVPDGAVLGATTGLAFERRRDRLLVRGNTGATYQEFFTAHDRAPSFNGAVTVAAKLATRFTVEAMAGASRSPFFQLALGAPASTPNPDMPLLGGRYTTRAMKNDAFEGAVGFASQFTRRSSIGATLTGRDTRFRDSEDQNYAGWAARGDFRHRVSRDATVVVGYAREEARQQSVGPDRYLHETINAGVDLDRSLSIARRTFLSFYSQTSMLREAGGPRRFRLNGGLTLRRDIARTWHVSLLASRDTEFHPGFVAPLLSHGGALSVDGLLSPRLEWNTNVSARRGQLGFDGLVPFNSYTATSRLTAALTKKTGLFCQYTFYHYDLPPHATVVDVPLQYSRQQLSIGVSVWLPIHTHVRVPRDPR